MASSNKFAIKLDKVKFDYSGNHSSPLLNIPKWQVESGEHVFVWGDSGSGKSTLLSLLCGLLKADAGESWILNEPLHRLSLRKRDRFRSSNIGYVAQRFNLIPYLSVLDNIKLAVSFSPDSSDKIQKTHIESLLDTVNLPDSYWHKPVMHLSVGQQQRVAIARAIVNKPQLIIADEPTSSLDVSNRDAFITMLMSTAEKHNMTLVFVSHDLSLKQHFNRVDSITDINHAGAQDNVD